MKTLITISREFGSGGLQIGQMVARELGYSFYDQELISLSAKERGLSEEYIQKQAKSLLSTARYRLIQALLRLERSFRTAMGISCLGSMFVFLWMVMS